MIGRQQIDEKMRMTLIKMKPQETLLVYPYYYSDRSHKTQCLDLLPSLLSNCATCSAACISIPIRWEPRR